MVLCVLKTRFGNSGDEGRQGWAQIRCRPPAGWRDGSERLCPDILRYLDRGLVRFGEKMEAVVLGRGARADHFGRGPVPRAARDRAPRLHTPRAVPKPR